MQNNTNPGTTVARTRQAARPRKLAMGYAYTAGQLQLWLDGRMLHSRPATMAQALAVVLRRAGAGATIAVGPARQHSGYQAGGYRTQEQVAEQCRMLGVL